MQNINSEHLFKSCFNKVFILTDLRMIVSVLRWEIFLGIKSIIYCMFKIIKFENKS